MYPYNVFELSKCLGGGPWWAMSSASVGGTWKSSWVTLCVRPGLHWTLGLGLSWWCGPRLWGASGVCFIIYLNKYSQAFCNLVMLLYIFQLRIWQAVQICPNLLVKEARKLRNTSVNCLLGLIFNINDCLHGWLSAPEMEKVLWCSGSIVYWTLNVPNFLTLDSINSPSFVRKWAKV